jgi:hypothetical protein
MDAAEGLGPRRPSKKMRCSLVGLADRRTMGIAGSPRAARLDAGVSGSHADVGFLDANSRPRSPELGRSPIAELLDRDQGGDRHVIHFDGRFPFDFEEAFGPLLVPGRNRQPVAVAEKLRHRRQECAIIPPECRWGGPARRTTVCTSSRTVRETRPPLPQTRLARRTDPGARRSWRD